MPATILLAGATGAIGKRLVPMLVRAGHRVFGTTRVPSRADALKAAGVEPVVIDVLDAQALLHAVAAIAPEIVIHQLTDLPLGLDPARMEEGLRRNARLRTEGTRNLVAAAQAAGVKRLVAQSIAWIYAPGPLPHDERARLAPASGDDARAASIAGVHALEVATLGTPGVAGIVLRYGRFYGPGTGVEAPGEAPVVHVDAAAHAALLAIDRGAPGVINIAEDCAYLSTARARRVLGWDAGFRLKD
jgi:nucleoside-diphosphate-sugar epimerase